MVTPVYSYVSGPASYTGKAADAVGFTLSHQLLDAETWKKFVSVYREDSDAEDDGWRNEYWGKMMRGACLTYMYTHSEELYGVLLGAAEDMLSAQRADGRFSTYPANGQYRGWDMWGRKYILTGFLHFYAICRDEALKARILDALERHADRILADIGPGKTDITETSSWWGGVNSCSVLEPFVELYKLTGKKRYFDFAEYILSTGGCRDGDLVELAKENRLMPFEYPETKAYETMSFFEGLLAMYEVTGNAEYLDIVEKFTAAVKRTDITVIGCAGCTHELFDNSALRQTVFSDGIMQETCVTVTWMRLNARLFLLTGKEKYYSDIEFSAYNALYGSLNTNMLAAVHPQTGEVMGTLPFDSYSPLFNQKRGRGTGGFKHFRTGGYYGCCACIASAGTALLPLTAVTEYGGGIAVNTYLNGTVTARTPAGNSVTLTVSTGYPASADAEIKVMADTAEVFSVKLRAPAFIGGFAASVNGEHCGAPEDGYITVRVGNGDTIRISGKIRPEKITLNGMTAFRYGVLTLARDARKENRADLSDEFGLAEDGYRLLPPEDGETIRMVFGRSDGTDLLLTDYASCGKNWVGEKGNISVWSRIV